MTTLRAAITPVVEDLYLAGDPRSALREQEGDDATDVVGTAQTLHRVTLGHLRLLALIERGGKRGGHDSGRNRVHAYAWPELEGELLGHVGEHRLRGAVQADALSGAKRGDRRDVDDRTAVLAHPRAVHLLGPRQRGEGIDLDDL